MQRSFLKPSEFLIITERYEYIMSIIMNVIMQVEYISGSSGLELLVKHLSRRFAVATLIISVEIVVTI